jgi:hypothetical protein
VIVDHLFEIINRHWVDREHQEGPKDVQTIRNVCYFELTCAWKLTEFSVVRWR